VLDDKKIPELLELIDASSIRVYQPTSLVFVCGGAIDVTSIKPRSLRDAFMRLTHKSPFNRHHALLAEDLNAFFPRGNYTDILSFESDFAHLSSVLIVFSESFGSAAELGAFAMVDDIAYRLLIVIDDKHYKENSFITLGPIRAMENKHGETAVCVLHRSDIKITSIDRIDGLDEDAFARHMAFAIDARISATKDHSTFDKSIPGHVIKLLVGLIQHYGALTFGEIEVALYCLDVCLSKDRLSNYLLCAEFADWIKKDKRGTDTFYAAVAEKDAMKYKLKPGNPPIDKLRWQADIMGYWKKTDQARFKSITEARRS
jgi:hypothetical protein